jgi:hypothetical protein
VIDDIHAAGHHLKAGGVCDLGDVEPIGADEDPVLFLSPKGSFGTLVELEQAGGGHH